MHRRDRAATTPRRHRMAGAPSRPAGRSMERDMSMMDEARAVANDARSIAGLLGNAVDQLGKLVQNELQLAKAEMAQKLAPAGMGVAYLAGAAIFIVPVLVMLL